MKIKKIIKISLISIWSLLLAMFVAFYLVIVVGIVPSIQETWVTTAMTTFTHQWLATSFVPEDKIQEIMERTRVDDSHMNTDVTEKLESSLTEDALQETDTEVDKDKKYTEQGYTKLEECIFIKDIDRDGVRGNVMLVTDPTLIKLAQSHLQFERGSTVKQMTSKAGAVAGINGGGFVDGPNYDSNGGIPAGLLIIDGKVINPREPDTKIHDMIGFRSDGAFILRHCTIEQALADDIKYAVEFSPYLVVNGEGTIKKGNGGWGIAPRTALGQRETGEVVFLVIDGRQVGWSIGCDLKLLQEILLEEDCINAAMMDGGSSTAMVYKGEYLNRPSLGHERYINNAWVIMSKENQ